MTVWRRSRGRRERKGGSLQYLNAGNFLLGPQQLSPQILGLILDVRLLRLEKIELALQLLHLWAGDGWAQWSGAGRHICSRERRCRRFSRPHCCDPLRLSVPAPAREHRSQPTAVGMWLPVIPPLPTRCLLARAQFFGQGERLHRTTENPAYPAPQDPRSGPILIHVRMMLSKLC